MGLVGIAGTAWQQSSFRAGALTASLPTMTVTEPVVGSVLGVVVLGETLRPGDAGWFTLVVAVAAMVVATAALARGEAAAAIGEAARVIAGRLVWLRAERHRDHPVGTRHGARAGGVGGRRSWPICARRCSRPRRRCRRAGSPSASAPPTRWSGPSAAGTFAGYGVDVRVALSPGAAGAPYASCRCAR